jgi:hypothetical protein
LTTVVAVPHAQSLTQPERLAAAAIYLAAIGIAGSWALGWIFPPFGIRGLWFYSAAAAVVLGEFILEPYFTRPADALANGFALLLTVAAVSGSGAAVDTDWVKGGRVAFIAYAVVILVASFAAILLKDTAGRPARIARLAYLASGTLGRARWVFGSLYFAAVYAAFADDAARLAILYLAWIVAFSAHPLDRLFRIRRGAGAPVGTSGRLIALEDPRVVVATLARLSAPRLGQTATVGPQEGHVVDVSVIAGEPLVRIALESPAPIGADDIIALGDDEDATIVGHVGPGTTIDDLVVQTAAIDATLALEEAQLLRARLRDRDVLFQITGATVQSRSDSIGDRDLLEIRAQKLGVWEAQAGGFARVSWVPNPGDVVRTFSVAADVFRPEAIGVVPGTEYGVRLDPGSAVTHNTAILGILGSGKTHLAWEIMKRLLLHGVKVVALDITGRYGREFDSTFPDAYRDVFEARIEAAIASTRNSDTVQDNEAGNVRAFRAAMRAALRDWYESACPLLILNPLNFDVTKMEGRPTFQGTAVTLARLTMVEITRITAESILELAIEHDAASPNESEAARVCVVLEEAHSLVPEWNAATSDAEKWAVNGTARAVLQGRKYGLGCLLVTQRTASVTKSILNQCNTIFALRAYDATGVGFLEHYIGAAYAPMLASLKERQAVVFGRASSCSTPIAVRLNDAAIFNASVWNPGVASLGHCDPADINPEDVANGGDEDDTSPVDDDIPF